MRWACFVSKGSISTAPRQLSTLHKSRGSCVVPSPSCAFASSASISFESMPLIDMLSFAALNVFRMYCHNNNQLLDPHPIVYTSFALTSSTNSSILFLIASSPSGAASGGKFLSSFARAARCTFAIKYCRSRGDWSSTLRWAVSVARSPARGAEDSKMFAYVAMACNVLAMLMAASIAGK